MLIKDGHLPQRYPILGRVRLGEKEKVTTKQGKEVERPKKGDNLRFTADDEVTLKAIASQLGGEVIEWPNGEQAYQLTTESPFVNVFLPVDPIDTSYERWGSGGCQRRCDGERCVFPLMSDDGGHLQEDDCLCITEGLTPGDRGDMKKGACQVTVRLRLVLPDVPGIGAWLCTSHSIYAAMELPGQVALLDAMRERGQLVPAEFGIEHREEKKAWEKYKRDYIVPVLRVRASLRQLGVAGSGVVAGELETQNGHAQTSAPALPAGTVEVVGQGDGAPPESSTSNPDAEPSEPPTPPPPPSAPPAGDPPPPRPARQPTAKKSGTGAALRLQTVRAAWKRTQLGEEELNALVKFATDKKRVEDLADVDEGNEVLAAITRVSAGELTLRFHDDDGAPYFVDENPTVEQGTLA